MTLYEALNEINKLQENVAGVEDVNGLLNEEVRRLRSELAEKEKKVEVLLKYESERDLFIFDQQHKIEELQKICEAADKVIEASSSVMKLINDWDLIIDNRTDADEIRVTKVIKSLKSSLIVYDQLKNTKP